MRLTHYNELEPIQPGRGGFRSGDITFRDLMTGTPGTPGNYGLQMVDVHERYAAPRHRHNFEQVRVMLDGAFGFGPGQVQEAGSVGYFCEGTYYTQLGEGRSTTLLLQIGGPSGAGFMSRAQLRTGIDELRQRGSFADGVFSWLDASGKKHNQDSYEAVWEHVHGQPIAYPKPQYDAPVLLRPERFAWRPRAETGVAERHLGCFNDAGLRLSMLRLEDGATHAVDATRQAQLMFCLEGGGSAGAQAVRRWSTLEVARDEDVVLRAAQPCEWFVFGLPQFG